MPTTCGFPNCKFRSRYRGSDDVRHFYRVPKKPSNLRIKWLEAIGRTEETIVSQLRVCSGHFEGGEKREGDVPVADPAVDKPLKVEIPPKVPRSSAQNRKKREKQQQQIKGTNLSCTTNSSSSPSSTGLSLGKSSPNSQSIKHNNKKPKLQYEENENANSINNSTVTPIDMSNLTPELALRLLNNNFQVDNSISTPYLPSNNQHLINNPNSNGIFNNNLSTFMQNLLTPLLLTSTSSNSFLPFNLKHNSNDLNNDTNISNVNNSRCNNGMGLFDSLFRSTNIPRNLSFTDSNLEVGNKENQNLNSKVNIPSRNIFIIDPSLSNWSFMDSNFKSNVLASEEEFILQNKNLSDIKCLIVWDNCCLTNQFIERLINLKNIIKLGCTIGYLDREFLQKKGITLTDLMSPCLDEVCENVFLTMLQCFRGHNGLLKPSPSFTNNNNVPLDLNMTSNYKQTIGVQKKSLYTSTLGIVGGGPLEIALATRAKSFGMSVLAFNNTKLGEYKWNSGCVEYVDDLSQLLIVCDVLIINTAHFPYIANPEQLLSHIKPGCSIINMQYNTNREDNFQYSSAFSSLLRCKQINLMVQNFNNRNGESIISPATTIPNSGNSCGFLSNCTSSNYLQLSLTQNISITTVDKLRQTALLFAHQFLLQQEMQQVQHNQHNPNTTSNNQSTQYNKLFNNNSISNDKKLNNGFMIDPQFIDNTKSNYRNNFASISSNAFQTMKEEPDSNDNSNSIRDEGNMSNIINNNNNNNNNIQDLTLPLLQSPPAISTTTVVSSSSSSSLSSSPITITPSSLSSITESSRCTYNCFSTSTSISTCTSTTSSAMLPLFSIKSLSTTHNTGSVGATGSSIKSSSSMEV